MNIKQICLLLYSTCCCFNSLSLYLTGLCLALAQSPLKIPFPDLNGTRLNEINFSCGSKLLYIIIFKRNVLLDFAPSRVVKFDRPI